MIFLCLLTVVHWLLVHGPDRQVLELNIDQISSIREPRAIEGHFHKDVKCIIIMSNNKLVTVVETCQQVLDLVNAIQAPK